MPVLSGAARVWRDLADAFFINARGLGLEIRPQEIDAEKQRNPATTPTIRRPPPGLAPIRYTLARDPGRFHRGAAKIAHKLTALAPSTQRALEIRWLPRHLSTDGKRAIVCRKERCFRNSDRVPKTPKTAKNCLSRDYGTRPGSQN